jgi:uncharacterized RDD family membrane protein YckC
MPEAEWIIQRGEERYPVADVSMLRDWAQKGNLLATDQIWSPVKGAWVMARDMSELSDVMVLPATTAAPAPQPITPAAVNAIGIRVAAYLIDVVPAIILGLICGVIGLIPIIGQIIGGALLGCYWLFRDYNGASLGKLLLGLVVVRTDGQPSSTDERIKRNLPLSIGGFLLAIPLIGYFVAVPIAVLISLIEAIMLLTQGYRLGDRLAGTTVVRKPV